MGFASLGFIDMCPFEAMGVHCKKYLFTQALGDIGKNIIPDSVCQGIVGNTNNLALIIIIDPSTGSLISLLCWAKKPL